MDVTRPVRRAVAATAALGLGLGLLGVAGAQAEAPTGSGATREAPPLITINAASSSSFSPDDDQRKDRLGIEFELAAPARVTVTIRDEAEQLHGTVRLGRLTEGRHRWTWDGRGDDGAVVPDRRYWVKLRASTGGVAESADELFRVDTLSPRGELVTSRPTVYPVASPVRDHVQLAWMLDKWDPGEEEFWGDQDRAARLQMEVRTRGGRLVWRKTARDIYTPVFDWYARRGARRALPPGRYVAHVRLTDYAGNRSQDRADLRVSHAQLVERLWTHTVAAAHADRYDPYHGGCLGCGDTCGPVASERFVNGLSFRPCASDWQFGASASFSADVPFAAAPVDSFRVTAVGGPTTPGSSAELEFGDGLGPGDDSATTPWRAVVLSGHPFFPARTRPATWGLYLGRPNSYDIATFTVEYRHYVPAG